MMRLARRASLLVMFSLRRRALARLLLTILVGGVPAVAEAAISLGSGFFITTDGYFVTGYHVIEKATTIKIRDPRGATLDASLAAKDVVNDLALLKVIGTFEALPIINSRSTRPGARVVTMGFPLPDIQGREPKLTDGIVNSVTGVDNNPSLFQISVAIQAGNSGGPLVNGNGNVIGVVIAKLSSLGVLQRTGDLPQNVNYAIKSNYLLEVVSTVEGLDARLLKPRTQAFPDLEQLGAFLSRSIGLVIVEEPEIAAAPVAPPEKAPATATLPRIWISLNSGSQFSIRLDEPYLQWVQLSSVSSGWVAGQGEATRVVRPPERRELGSSIFTGVGRVIVRNPWTLQTCTLPLNFNFSLVTPRRIEGYSEGYVGLNWNSCSPVSWEKERPFVWVPQAE